MSIRDKLLKHFGIEEPPFATFSGWDEFHKKVKIEHPIAWFCIDTVPEQLAFYWNRVTRPFKNFRNALRYRFRDKYHIINTGLKPEYADYETRMLHGMFNLLVEFVEKDNALVHQQWVQPDQQYNFFQRLVRHFTFHGNRPNPQHGLDYIKLEMNLVNSSPQQAEIAREIWQIYHWWKFVRPERQDPQDVSGWSQHCTNIFQEQGWQFGDTQFLTQEDRELGEQALKNYDQIEQSYHEEDEEYLIRLIQIRQYLWV